MTSLILSIISTIFALIAICVSVWQTIWPYKTKLKVIARVVDSKFQYELDKFYRKKLLFLKISNIGFNDCPIVEWRIMIDKKHKFHAEYFGNKPLNISKKSFIKNSYELLVFKDPVKTICKRKISNKYLYVYIEELGGKIFKKKLNLRVNDFLNMKDEDFFGEIPESEYENYMIDDYDFGSLRSYMTNNGFKK